MQDHLVRSLRLASAQIRTRWEALLHAEPVTTPLAYPDALVHLIDSTLDDLFFRLATQTFARPARLVAANFCQYCPCGRNPLLTYFTVGEQALCEALVLTQAASPSANPSERDASLEELLAAYRELARREIESFCGVCQHRAAAERHEPVTVAVG